MVPGLILAIVILFLVFMSPQENFLPGYTRKWRTYPHSKPAGYPTAQKPWFITEEQSQQGNGLPYYSYGDYKYY